MENENNVIDFKKGKVRVRERQRREKLREILDKYFPASRFAGIVEEEKEGWLEAIARIFKSKNFQSAIDEFVKETRAWLDGQQIVDGARTSILNELKRVIGEYKNYVIDEIVSDSVKEGEIMEGGKNLIDELDNGVFDDDEK